MSPPGGSAVEIDVPAAEARLGLLDRVDDADAFFVPTSARLDTEGWMRTVIDDAPGWFRLPSRSPHGRRRAPGRPSSGSSRPPGADGGGSAGPTATARSGARVTRGPGGGP